MAAMLRYLVFLPLVGLWMAGCTAQTAAQSQSLPKYRDLQAYATSKPDAQDAQRVILTMRLVNAGSHPLDIQASLGADAAAGFAGGTHAQKLSAGQSVDWNLPLTPPAGLKRVVLQGKIHYEGQPWRDLYVALEGPDPAGFVSKDVETLKAGASAVGAYAPLTQAARASLGRGDGIKNGGLILASKGQSEWIIDVSVLHPKGQGKVTLEQLKALPGLTPSQLELLEAVADLQRCIGIQSEATLPLWAGPDRTGKAIILEDRSKYMKADELSKLHPESYKLSIQADSIVIASRTLEGLGHGVYGLLTDNMGCRWFMPGTVGEEIPVPGDKVLRLSKVAYEIHSPSFFSANGMSWGSSPQWDRRNRAVINRGRMVFGHAWRSLISPQEFPYEKLPDMWARDRQGKILLFDRGWSWTNFCSTSPQVIEVVTAKINQFFDANPQAIVASLDPNDLAPLCLCERCLALDKQYGIENQDGEHMADRLLHFSRQIHERLKPEHQGKFLGILAYGHQTNLPLSAKPHDQHATIVCDFPPYFDHTRPFSDPTSAKNRQFDKIVRGWGQLSKSGHLGFYDYYGHYNFFGPWGVIHKMREDLPAFKELGGTFLVIEAQPNFGMNGLNLYIAAQLAWNIDADVDALLEEYFIRFYGPAAESMRQFWLGAERDYALTRPGTNAAQRVAMRNEFWTQLQARLGEAETAAQGAEQRVRDRLAFHRDGFEFGRKMYEFSSRYLPHKGDPIDLAGGIKHIKDNKDKVAQFRQKYPGDKGYWPPLVAPYFYPPLDQYLTAMEEALQDPAKAKTLGERLDSIGG